MKIIHDIFEKKNDEGWLFPLMIPDVTTLGLLRIWLNSASWDLQGLSYAICGIGDFLTTNADFFFEHFTFNNQTSNILRTFKSK